MDQTAIVTNCDDESEGVPCEAVEASNQKLLADTSEIPEIAVLAMGEELDEDLTTLRKFMQSSSALRIGSQGQLRITCDPMEAFLLVKSGSEYV